MSSTQLRRLGIVLVAVVVLWGILALVNRQSTEKTSAFVLPKIDTASVDTVALVGPRDTSIIVRTARGQWQINGHAASAPLVGQLLTALRDTAAWSELAAEHKSSHERLGVSADSGEHVRVVSRGKVLLDMIAGKPTPDFAGLYVRRPTEEAVYAIHSDLGTSLKRPTDDWRDKQIAAVMSDSVDTIQVQRGAKAYTLRRSGRAWSFANGGAADSAAVADILVGYRDLVAAGFASPVQAESLHFQHPKDRTRLVTKAGRPLANLMFDSTSSGTWARADSGGTVWRLDSWTVNRLVPADSTVRAKKPKTK